MQGVLGVVTLFGGNFAPLNTTMCYGQLIAISENNALFSLLSNFYGGDGRTSFGIPDLRGRSPIGTGQGPGLSNITLGQHVGSESTVIQESQMPTHTHAAIFTPSGGAEPTATMKAFNGTANQTNPDSNYLSSPSSPIYRDGPGLGITEVELAADAITITGGGTGAGSVTVEDAGASDSLYIRGPSLGMTYVIFDTGIYPSRN